LHPVHGRIQVVTDVSDHHVHVRAREAADELRERERNKNPPQRTGRPSYADILNHATSSSFYPGERPAHFPVTDARERMMPVLEGNGDRPGSFAPFATSLRSRGQR